MSMSNGSNFVELEEKTDLSSLYESDFYHSNHESTSLTETHDGGDPRDYWFGKKYFQCILAQHLLPQIGSARPSSTIDSLFEKALRIYPYQEVLQVLQSRGNFAFGMSIKASQNEDYETLMRLIGSCVRTGTNEQKHRFIGTIRRFADTYQNGNTGHSAAEQSTRVQDMGFESSHSSDSPPINEVDSGISRYTSALKEKADRLGTTPEYEIQRVTTDTQTPQFKAIVKFQDHRFEGSGRSKQQAKHQASKEACQSLNI